MSFIAANYLVGLKVHSTSGRDAHNKPVESWADPVDFPACWWATPTARGDSSGEPKLAGHSRVVVEQELCTPTSFPASPRDRVIIPGKGEFEVLGEAEDHNHGPFGFVPDVVIWNLRKVVG